MAVPLFNLPKHRVVPKFLSFDSLILILAKAFVQKICHFASNELLLLDNILLVQHVVFDLGFVATDEVTLAKEDLMGDNSQCPDIYFRTIVLSAKQLR